MQMGGGPVPPPFSLALLRGLVIGFVTTDGEYSPLVHLINRRSALRVATLFCTITACALTLMVPASASTNRSDARRSAQPPPELLAGVTVTGAKISTPGAPPRTLDANQATAFMQAWLPDSVFTQPVLPNVKPPTNLPVSHLDVTTVWHAQTEKLIVFYASDGTTAWVGMPAQSFGWAGVDHERWIAAPQSARLRQAFAGKLQPVRPPPATTTTPTTQSKAAGSTGGSSDSSSGVWWGVGIAVIVVLGALALFTLRRRTAGAASARGRSV
jgi:hypothetical protein